MSERICSVPGCENRSLRATYCATHRWRWKKYGSFDLPTGDRALKTEACRGGGCTAAIDPERNRSGLCRRCNRRAWYQQHRDLESMTSRASSANRRSGSDARRVTREELAAVLEVHGMVCHICSGVIESMTDLHFDHVVPIGREGENAPENIRPAHAACNLSKRDKLLI